MSDNNKDIATLFEHLNHLESTDEILFKFINAINYIFQPLNINMVEKENNINNLYIDLKVKDEIIGKLEILNTEKIDMNDILELKKVTEKLCEILTKSY